MADRIFKKSENLLQTDPASGFLLKREGELKERLSELKRIKSDKSIRKWKSESSFLNGKAGSKCHTMCASERKDDRKKKIPTDGWEGRELDLWKALAEKGMAYISAGRNSLSRNVLVADVDDPSWTSERIKAELEAKGLKPSYVREHLSNGHKQVGFLFNEIQIKKAVRREGKPLSLERIDGNFQAYTAAYRALNSIILPGDPGYTGYNCQNPFYESGEWKTEWIDAEPKEFKGLFAEIAEAAQSGKPRPAAKKKESPSKPSKSEPVFLDELESEIEALERRLSAISERIEKKLLHSQEKNKYDNSYDKLYFVTCTQVANRWRKMEKLSERFVPLMAEEALANMDYLGPTGYSDSEAKGRVLHDLNQILKDAKSESPAVDWSSVGWTPLQRALSLKSRKDSKISKIERALAAVSALSESKWARLSLRRLAERISPLCGMGESQARDFLGSLRQAVNFLGLDRKDSKKMMSSFDFRNLPAAKFFDKESFLQELKGKFQGMEFKALRTFPKKEEENNWKSLKKEILENFLIIDYNNKKDKDYPLAKALGRIFKGFSRDKVAYPPPGRTKSLPMLKTA